MNTNFSITFILFQPQTNGVEKIGKPNNNERVSSPEQDSQRQGEWTRL